MSLRSLCLAVALSSSAAAACDPDQALGELAPPAKAPDPAKAAADAAATQAADARKAASDGFAACMAGCFEGKSQSATDRQTCRLTCGADRLASGGHGPSAEVKAAIGRFDACLDADCSGPGSATDAATCRLTCAQAALAGDAAPALASTARGCAVSCLEQTGDCNAACTGGPDDAATCHLQCTTLGERCLGRCEHDPTAEPVLTRTPPDAKPFPGDETKTQPPSVPEQTRKALPPAPQ